MRQRAELLHLLEGKVSVLPIVLHPINDTIWVGHQGLTWVFGVHLPHPYPINQ